MDPNDRRLFIIPAPGDDVSAGLSSSQFAEYHVASEMDEIFRKTFTTRLVFSGFEPVRGSRKAWFKQGPEFKCVFFLNSVHHNGAYLPCGAISLDFVPAVENGGFARRWKFTSQRVHLSFDHGPDWRNFCIDRKRSTASQLAEQLGETLLPRVIDWLDSFKTLSDVLQGFEQFKARQGRAMDFYCYPTTALAFAFTLAKLGRRDEARHELSKAFDNTNFFSEDMQAQIRTDLEAH